MTTPVPDKDRQAETEQSELNTWHDQKLDMSVLLIASPPSVIIIFSMLEVMLSFFPLGQLINSKMLLLEAVTTVFQGYS